MSEQVRITSVIFTDFKAFSSFTLRLDNINVLVGPNNSGKSTILSAFRALAIGVRHARSKKPQLINTSEGMKSGWVLSSSHLPLSLENVHNEYSTTDSKVVFVLSNGNKLSLLFPRDGGCVLVTDVKRGVVNTSASFKAQFPIEIAMVPILGPVEHKEKVREKTTVASALNSHMAARHFRNYWHYFKEGFSEFADLIRETWPGMEIETPEHDQVANELSMFCREDRITRELYWSGFGFQIWCQLLTHISRSKGSTLVIVDEPEVYLHPDVQRQLLSILKTAGPDILLATHSTEIMAEAEPVDIVMIDKTAREGKRLKDIAGVQKALEAVGSIQNITLTALARNRRVVFVEGEDFKLIRRFATRLGMSALGTGQGINCLASGGFGSWQKVKTLASGVEDALGVPLKIAVVYDRDYLCDEQIDEIKVELGKSIKLAHIHVCKEIENFLLNPDVLERAAKKAINEKRVRNGLERVEVQVGCELLLRQITEDMRKMVLSQHLARKADFFRHHKNDPATHIAETMIWFEEKWENLKNRLEIVPGKEVLRLLREKLNSQYGISLSDTKIVDSFHRDEIHDDMTALVNSLDEFRLS